MYYYSSQSRQKVLHTADCYHKRMIRTDYLSTTVDVWQELANGYHFCKCCDPLGQKFQQNCQQLIDYQQQHGLSVRCRGGSVHISTPMSRWLIVYADNQTGTTLYHRNTWGPKNPADLYPGYHAQRVNCPDLYHYLEYIVNHDYFRMMHPLNPPQAKKDPPKKGTKRYRKAQKRQRKQEHRAAVKNVLNLIDSMVL